MVSSSSTGEFEHVTGSNQNVRTQFDHLLGTNPTVTSSIEQRETKVSVVKHTRGFNAVTGRIDLQLRSNVLHREAETLIYLTSHIQA